MDKLKDCLRVLKLSQFDAFLISNPINITYLTGFKQPCGYLLIALDKKPVYFTNPLYKREAEKIMQWELVVSDNSRNILNLVTEEIIKLNLKKVGFESRHIPFAEYKAINEYLLSQGIDFLEAINFVEKLRMLKDSGEIALIKKAIEISAEAFEFVGEIFNPGMTEKNLSIEIEKFLRVRGDNEIAFSSVVAAGSNTVFPHHLPGPDKIGKKFFLIDLGSKHYGYCADLTRVFFWGKMPLLFKKIYATVKQAQDLAIKKIKDGVTAAEVDKAAREFIDKKGWGKYFVHGLGHGIGQEVHELPYLRAGNKEVLREGMVVTVEPAIYFKNRFGIRIEDMVLVRQKKGEILSGDVNRGIKAV